MKKIKYIILIGLVVLLSACASQSTQTTKTNEQPKTVKIGVVGSAFRDIWQFVAEKAKAENINLEVVELNDYVKPNVALAEGSLDMNSYQHRAYLNQWNKERPNDDLQEIGVTIITPLYYFSNKVKSLTEVPENGKIAVPKEVAIQGRALVALQKVGLITLKNGGSTKSSLADIETNPKNIEFIEVDSAQAPRILNDVDAATIGGTFAKDAGLSIKDNIFTDADYLELIPKDRYNIIVVKGKDKENETYKKIVKLFQADDVIAKMNDISPGQYYPVWDKK